MTVILAWYTTTAGADPGRGGVQRVTWNQGIAVTDKTIAGEKTMFKYRLDVEKISDPSCCGSFGACLDWMLQGIKSPLGLGFFLHSSMFQLHVYDSLYSQALAYSQVPSGIEFTENPPFLLKIP